MAIIADRTTEEPRRAGTNGVRTTVVLPAYNEGAALPHVLDELGEYLDGSYEVLVVDDGSTDDTAERARQAGAEVVRHSENRGKGAALATAFARLLAENRCDAVVTLDADGQHDPDDIPAFADLYVRQRPALIVGSRHGDFTRMWGPRRAMNRFSSASLRLFTGVDLPDSQSGFRLYDVRFLERLRLEGRRYEAEMEALMRAAEWKMPIASVPIRLRVVDGRATSHYRPLRDTFRIVGMVLRQWLRCRFASFRPGGS